MAFMAPDDYHTAASLVTEHSPDGRSGGTTDHLGYAVFDSVTDGFLVTDATGHLTYVNAAIARVFGCERDDLVGRVVWDAFPEAVGLPFFRHYHRVLKECRPIQFVAYYPPLDLWLETRLVPLADDGIAALIWDISERKRLERERAMTMRMVGHDLVTPLAAMQVYVQAQQRRLRRGEAPFVPTEHLLASIEYALERATRLLDDLQVLAGIETGMVHLDRTPCDLSEVCRGEGALQRVITNRDIQVVLPDQPVTVLADRERIGQVVANLLSNALKYSPADTPVVLTLCHEAAQARVEVRDAGPGIPQAEQQRIWEQFHRVPGIETQDGSSGLGLGLFISRAIIEGHSGRIGVESAVGSGSTFWFTLPLVSMNMNM